jgi:hypothetical protein
MTLQFLKLTGKVRKKCSLCLIQMANFATFSDMKTHTSCTHCRVLSSLRLAHQFSNLMGMGWECLLVHWAVKKVALFATCRHICKLTPLLRIAGFCPARGWPTSFLTWRGRLGIFAVVHCAVNRVALYATCRHMSKLTPLLQQCTAQSSHWLTHQCLHLFPAPNQMFF